MKHNLKITVILIVMFILTQLIGVYIISEYQKTSNNLPYGMEPPHELNQNTSLFSILIGFIIAIGLFFILIRFKADIVIKIWFFAVTIIATALAINIIFLNLHILYASIIALVLAIVLSYFKLFKRNLLVHNLTELLIYPGIAAVFVPILNVPGIIILLLLISIYDICAVWHTGFMQKMANYQINTLRFFTGFFIPYADKKQKDKIKLIKEKYANKSEKIIRKQFEKAKIKIHLAILGGGDIIFPIITAGVFYKVYHSLTASLIITLFATLALLYLFVFAKKGKFYPAMPFITIGMYIGMIIAWTLIALHII